jgi:nucleoid-associated protein YgaU
MSDRQFVVACHLPASCRTRWADFEDVFKRAMESLPVGERLPSVTPTSCPGITYTVKAGDTLSQIAKDFGVTVEALVEANGIKDPSLIRVGEVLIIPPAKPESN